MFKKWHSKKTVTASQLNFTIFLFSRSQLSNRGLKMFWQKWKIDRYNRTAIKCESHKNISFGIKNKAARKKRTFYTKTQ
jgi:hypothetical protein